MYPQIAVLTSPKDAAGRHFSNSLLSHCACKNLRQNRLDRVLSYDVSRLSLEETATRFIAVHHRAFT